MSARVDSAKLSWSLSIPTTKGEFVAMYSDAGLRGIRFPGVPAPKAPAEIPGRIQHWHQLTRKAVAAVLTGKPIGKLPPFDLAEGTDFQRQVWDELTRIPAGQSKSYGEIAETLGKPGAARAVGSACGANPIPVIIPCHRVLASSKRLGGFSGGLEWKRRLLQAEGVTV
jgi:methylated-DNA-[protein]-cysteine S-methyltransferase